MKDLVIVESPTKVKTIKKILGKGVEVKATVGHIKDLPKNSLGVDIKNNFTPEYVVIPGKEKIIESLKKSSKKADRILIATDPDREGEAIAWHVKEEIGDGKDIFRVLIHEITKKGVKEALKNPQSLDINRFSAQKARRVLDRLVGYLISPLLWDKVKRGLSAGRVQSVAVRLICEREEEIRRFKPEEYWEVYGEFEIDGFTIRAKLSERLKDKEEVEKIKEKLKRSKFYVSKVEKKTTKAPLIPPFITSTLQQEAYKRFKFSPKKTMMIAQRLYEGVEIGDMGSVGLITYMRTDSVRVSDEAIRAVRGFIKEEFGEDYLPKFRNIYKNRKSSQDAHEAIRPTRIELTPDKLKKYLDRDHLRLYELIWKRFVASQMLPPMYDELSVEVKGDDLVFKAKFRKEIFKGYHVILRDEEEKGEKLPDIKEGKEAKVIKIEEDQKFTKPPPRYSVSTLIKTLEEKGIGRPSTYATIVSTIQERGYVTLEKGFFKPTLLGEVINNLLVKYFPTIMDVGFTATMEERLDKVEEGEERWEEMVRDFFKILDSDLSKARSMMDDLKRNGLKTSIICEICGSPMVIRFGKNSPYIVCSKYPECKNRGDIEIDEKGEIKIKKEEDTGRICKICGSPLVVKKGKFGRFLACKSYPDCNYTEPFPIGVKCPLCGEDVVERVSKSGRIFYSCSSPKCSFISWDEPFPKECECGSKYLVIKKGRRGKYLQCPSCRKNYSLPKSSS